MKILLLTKNHPTETLSVVSSIHGYFQSLKKVTCISPQCVAAMVEEAKGIPYTAAFYPALHQVELQKEDIAKTTENLIIVGTADNTTKTWYDIIIGLNNPEINDYKVFEEDFNVQHYKCFTLKDAEVTFDNINEVLTFLARLMRMKEKNEI